MKTSLLIFLCSVLAVAAADIVEDTCKKCSAGNPPGANYTSCVNSFYSVPESRSADLRGLGVIAANLADAKAKLVTAEIKKLESSSKDPNFKQPLETCLELYSDSLSDLEDAATAFRDGRYSDANVKISAAVDVPGLCDDGFSEGGIESPLKTDNHGFLERASVALGVSAILLEKV